MKQFLHVRFSATVHHRLLVVLGLLALPLLFQGGLLQPREAAGATITCSSGISGCHFKTGVLDTNVRNVPAGLFLGTHARHSGYSTGSKRQYQYACTKCHPSTSYTNAHQTGFKNITGSSLPGASYSKGKLIANTNTPVFGNCSQLYCHSNGRATGLGLKQYSSVRWGGSETCLGCHGGRSTVSPYNPARSVGNFTLSTSHSQHLKYPAANMNCQICHAKTATSATALKNYTGVQRHVNGVSDVYFTDIAYASYTSYKTKDSDIKKCANTSCHGGKSRGAWSATAQNTDHTCSHCHGVSGTTVAAGNADKRLFAPGFRRLGTSTDQVVISGNLRVGSHFKHLSSLYMKNIKCNECHKVPSTPFSADTNHTLNTQRFNSATLTFVQASSARWDGVSNTNLASFGGYTNGTAVKAATCSSTYCHGSRLKNGDTAGTYRKPYWNYSAMVNYTVINNACGRCHGNPPTSVSASHNGKTPTTSCSGCHGTVVNAAGVIVDKTLHINGKVEAAGGHAFPYPGATHSVATGATNPAANCTCHDYTTAGTYPVTSGTAPKCLSCHTAGFYRAGSGTTSCYDCHGSGATAALATPNSGTTFPNWSGSHATHVTGQGMACSDCHNNGGTGNTAHGHSNGVAKTRLTVNVQQGGSATFTYTASSQTCSTVSCHGNAVWSVTTFDCISCHAGVKGTRRIVTTELGASATKNSHHVTSGTLTKWHCIVCHAEGNTSTGGATGIHGDGKVDLRNVDSVANPGTAGTNYYAINDTKTATDYTNLDTFCMRCHDSVGSAQIAINASNALIISGLTTTNQQKPFNDNLTNAYDMVARTRVLDVETQFVTTSPSHHAVRGAKYSSTGTQYLFNDSRLTGTTVTGTTIKDSTTLHCHDCHYLNGHGTTNEYMLQASNGTDTLHTKTTYGCYKCHPSSMYNGANDAHGPANGSDTTVAADGATGTARIASKCGNYTNIYCINCHASNKTGGTGSFWGGIHGTGGASTYTDVNSTTQTNYRFMPGMANQGYAPGGWTGAGRTVTCYTPSNTSWSGCTSHSKAGGTDTTLTSPARPLSY